MGLGYQHVRKAGGTWGGGQGLPHCAASSILQPTLPAAPSAALHAQIPKTSPQPPLTPSLLCPVPPAVSSCWHVWFPFHTSAPCICLPWIPFSLFQSVSLIYQDHFSEPVPDFPASCQLHVQHWVLFSNYSLCKKAVPLPLIKHSNHSFAACRV